MVRVPSSTTEARAQRDKLNQALLRLEKRVAALEAAEDYEEIPLAFDASTLLVYLHVNRGNGTAAALTDRRAQKLLGYTAEIVEVVLYVISTAYGSTTVTAIVDGAAQESETKDLPAAVNTTFNLGTRIEAGQRLAISFLAAANGGEVTGHVKLRRIA